MRAISILFHSPRSSSPQLHSSTFVSYDVEPFNQDWGTVSKGGPYPHGLNSNGKSPLPLNIYYAWTLPSDDAFWKQAALDTAEVIKATARADGQKIGELRELKMEKLGK